MIPHLGCGGPGFDPRNSLSEFPFFFFAREVLKNVGEHRKKGIALESPSLTTRTTCLQVHARDSIPLQMRGLTGVGFEPTRPQPGEVYPRVWGKVPKSSELTS